MTANTVPGDPASWRDNAACLEHPAEWFTGPHQPGDTQRAIDVCNTCPVKQPCLHAALEIEVSADLGIWGGTTPTTRRRLRRERARNPVAPHDDRHPPPEPRPTENLTVQADRLRLFEDDHGDFIDQSGRVIVFKIHGDPPFMLMVDGRPRARTSCLDDAAGLAARFLTRDPRETDVRAEDRTPRERTRRRTT
jgi:WhiB family transcriptional regulator, redox-sensing transcriptional regulator